MTTETAPRPVRQVRKQDGNQHMASRWVLVAAVAHMLLHDRRFHATVITGAIGAVALAGMIKDNQTRPIRRVAAWYNGSGGSQELARARAQQPGQRS